MSHILHNDTVLYKVFTKYFFLKICPRLKHSNLSDFLKTLILHASYRWWREFLQKKLLKGKYKEDIKVLL